MKKISAEEQEELTRLRRELEQSYLRGAELMRAGGGALDSDQLARLKDEESLQYDILSRIKEIHG